MTQARLIYHRYWEKKPAKGELEGSMRTLIPVQIALSLVVAGSSASAITIDNFEEGPFSVSSPSGEVSNSQGGLSTLNVISGQRTVVVQSTGNVATTADLALTAGDDAADLAGDPSAVVSGFRFEYAFGSPFDLTLGGSLDRFVVDITAASGTPELRFNLVYGETIYATPAAQISGAGTITLLFSDWFLAAAPAVGPPADLDLTQVEELRMIGGTYGSFSVSNIAAIPEPSTAVLLGCGLLAVAARRTRLHCRRYLR